jgi:hypothetical protein
VAVVRLLAGSKLALAAVAAVSAVAGAGGFYAATQLTAEVVNHEQTVTLGTLILSNRVGDGAACLSAPDLTTDRNAQTCDAAFDLGVRKPGDSATAQIEIANVGVLDASALRVYAPQCADDNAEPFHGSGSPCAKLQLYIQLWTDATRATPATCLYGGSADGKRCDFSDPTKTIAAFVSVHDSVANALAVGPLPHGQRDHFTIGVRLPSDTDNSYQGRRATTSLAWHMTQ